jgi:molecular chaperone GrpE (heat shock protein)
MKFHDDKSNEDMKEDNNQENTQNLESSMDINELQNTINSLQAEKAQLLEEKDKYLRASANLQNMYNELKETVKKDIERSIQREQLNFFNIFISFREMLLLAIGSVRDNLNPLAETPVNKEEGKILQSLLSGIDMVDKSIITTVSSKYQLEEIPCNVMDEFDYNIHDAKQNIVTKNIDLNNKIAKILQKGYKNKDRIIKSPAVEVYQYLENNPKKNTEEKEASIDQDKN